MLKLLHSSLQTSAGAMGSFLLTITLYCSWMSQAAEYFRLENAGARRVERRRWNTWYGHM